MTQIESRLRSFLLLLAASVFPFVAVELLFERHTQEPMQFVPFVLSGLGLVTVALALWRPTFITIWVLRIIMVSLLVGAILGMYEHLEGDVSFQQDIRPGSSFRQVLPKAIHGAAPILAPGILAFAGLLAMAATYAHPALGSAASRQNDRSSESAALPRATTSQ
jgi:hypothetical protein